MRGDGLVSITMAVFLSGASAAAQVDFAAKPTVTTGPEGLRIAFAVTAPTDVEVAILDGKGNVVKHLAAGLLGENAPAPLKKGALSQALVWDRTDDAGRPAEEGAYRARVRLKLGVKFERVVAWEPPSLASRGVVGFDVDQEGRIYGLNVSLWEGRGGGHQLMVWNRAGRYLRQIMPIRRDVDLKRLPGVEFTALPSGQRVPNNVYWPGVLGTRCVMLVRDGRVTMFGSPRGTPPLIHLVRIEALDGGAPPEGHLGPALPGEFGKRFPGYLAASPDGKTLYVAGMGDEKGTVMNVVCRARWGDKAAETLIGKDAGLSDPRGLATDAKGRLYVSDFNHDRLCVFSPEGKHLKSLPVIGPEQVEVDPKSGAVYVYSVRDPDVKRTERKSLMYQDKVLVKFAGLDDWREVAALALPRRGRHMHDAGPIMALDTSGKEPAILISYVGRQEEGDHLWKVIDRGAKLERVAAPVPRYCWPFQRAYCAMAIDRQREEVYLAGRSFDRFYRMNGRTGQLADVEAITKEIVAHAALATDHPQVTGVAVDREGRIYVRLMGTWSSRDNLIRRYDRQGRRVPFTRAAKVGAAEPRLQLPAEAKVEGDLIVTQPSRGYHSGGLAVAKSGDLYVIQKAGDPKTGEQLPGNANVLNVYGPDGAFKRCAMPWLSAGAWGPCLDQAGNLYLTDAIRPNDPAITSEHTGSLVKYGPQGGRVNPGAEAGQYVTRRNERDLPPTALQNAQWAYYGAGLIPFGHCVCSAAQFDLDDFGRSVVPDVNRYRVKVIDSGGNFLLAFGEYGNWDSAGPASAVGVPEIPLWEPNAVAVCDRAAYIYDRRAHRILCVTFTHAAESEAEFRLQM